MRAAILSIGDELALGQTLDTNSQWLAARLMEQSIVTVEHRTVADDRSAIAGAIAQLAPHCEVLLITGGLGPTDDDLTRESLGDVIAPRQEMVLDQAALEHISRIFQKRSRVMPPSNRKQALRPAPMRCLPNPNGTAPGLAGELGRCQVFAMPGPPSEMRRMFADQVLPAMRRPATGEVVLTAAVHEFGMGESDAAQRLGSMMDRGRNPLVGTTASAGIVSARIRAEGPIDVARRQLDEAVQHIERAWQPYAFGCGDMTLADSAGELLRRACKRLATAESCTGGWLGKAIVDVAGSSDYYAGGWITYSNAMKSAEIGVPAELIAQSGAVSEPVARAMAEGALRQSGADYALSITGIAGPVRADAPSEKPVGTVLIGLATREGTAVDSGVRQFRFAGDRGAVRDRSVKAALQMLRFALLKLPRGTPLLWEVGPVQRAAHAGAKSDQFRDS